MQAMVLHLHSPSCSMQAKLGKNRIEMFFSSRLARGCFNARVRLAHPPFRAIKHGPLHELSSWLAGCWQSNKPKEPAAEPPLGAVVRSISGTCVNHPRYVCTLVLTETVSMQFSSTGWRMSREQAHQISRTHSRVHRCMLGAPCTFRLSSGVRVPISCDSLTRRADIVSHLLCPCLLHGLVVSRGRERDGRPTCGALAGRAVAHRRMFSIGHAQLHGLCLSCEAFTFTSASSATLLDVWMEGGCQFAMRRVILSRM